MKTPHLRGQHAHCGFTLIELMIALAVLSILLGIGLPNFANMISSHRAKSYSHQIYGSYQFARHEAVKRGKEVTLCGSDDGNNCMRYWHKELLVFMDHNDNKTMEEDELIRIIPINFKNGYVHSRLAFGNKHVRFNNDASNKGGGSFIVCQPNARQFTKQVVFQYTRPYFYNVKLKNDKLYSSQGDVLDC